jgi:hypothetical protein
MLILSSAVSWRAAPVPPLAAPPVARVVVHASPSRTAAGRAGSSNSVDPASWDTAVLHGGPNAEGLQRVQQSLSPSMFAAIESGQRGLPLEGYETVSHVARGAPLSGLQRVYEWSADTVGQFFGGSAQAAPSSWRGERDAGRAAMMVRDQPGFASARAYENPRAPRSVSPEDFIARFNTPAHPIRTRCNRADRADSGAYFPNHVNPSMCPVLSRTVSSRISAQAAGAAGGAQRALEGTQGVLSSVRVRLPSNAASLTVKVSREGGVPRSDAWNLHTGIAGISARIVSGRATVALPNIVNCRPVEPRTGEQACSIPVVQGRVDGKRFVTVEVFAARGGAPIRLEVAAQPA